MKRHGKALVMWTSVPCDSQSYPDRYLERFLPEPVEAGTRSISWLAAQHTLPRKGTIVP